MSMLDKLSSKRFGNVMIAIFNILLLLLVFYLGMNAAYWTNQQVKEYCINYNEIPKNKTNYNITWNATLNIDVTR